MLTRLRRRFILITMGLVGLVLLVVLATSVISSYQTTAAGIENALDQAVSKGPDDRQRPWVGGQDTNPLFELFPWIMGRTQDATSLGQGQDSRFTPVYVVALDPSSLTVLGDNSAFVIIDTSLASEAITTVVEKLPRQGLAQDESLDGLLLDLQLFYRVEVFDDGSITIALADASELLDDTLLMTGVSTLIWLGAMVALFFISLLLSRIVTRPVAEAWERQRRFVADASHELKTPLTVILANNSLLTAHPDKTVAEQEQWVHSTQTEAQRMDSLVRDLLLLAQTDDEGKRPKSATSSLPTVDLSALLSHSLLQFEAVFFERNVELTSEIAEGVTLSGETEQLERLIQILLDNASKYAGAPVVAATAAVPSLSLPLPPPSSPAPLQPQSPPPFPQQQQPLPLPDVSGERMPPPDKAAVHISLQRGQGGAHALLRVTNTGTPIAPDALPHLFERFFRADAAHSDTEGAGLGLPLAQAIVVAHHGTITVSSTAAAGTTFTVTL
jgi:signal transduction histidine kinase